jgi:hypothetical protein
MRHPIQNAHAGNYGEYMAQDEADCNERSGRQDSPDKEKSKSKNKSKNAAKEKTLLAHRLLRPPQQDFPAPNLPKRPKSKNKSSLDKRRFHT